MSISIDIDIDDILWNMSDREKQELVDDLYEDGYRPKQVGGSSDSNNILDDAWEVTLSKLSKGRLMLTTDEEELIHKIANRLPY
jgi:hypothetical protein